MDTYRVSSTIQSAGNDPVEMKWYVGEDKMEAFIALGQAMKNNDDHPVVGFRVLSVRIDIETVVEGCVHPGLFATGAPPESAGPEAYDSWLESTKFCAACGVNVQVQAL